MIGSISEVSSTSTLRRERRRQRPAMVTASAAAVRAPRAISDIGGLRLGGGGRGGVAREGQEDVVERRLVDGEARDGVAAGIRLVEQTPDLGGRAVGVQAEDEPAGVGERRARAEAAADGLEGVRA